MRLNRRGEGGFIESVIAVMAIIITLTVFLSFLAFSTSQYDEREKEMPMSILDDVKIISGNIEADIEGTMDEIIGRYGYTGMRVILSAASIYDSSVTFSAGKNDSDKIISKNGTIIVRSDDGRSVPVNYSMAVWL
ncbi:MAG: hypothetical protein LBE48_05555 [Methanomassiliicoccaceae archaeon]|jgi:hypothetical protein|nr:hypothetical protein [Methanomassiliicoccaceae archaeon]